MKLMTFKISESLLKELDTATNEFHFSNRTEFIRTAIREKIEKCKTVDFISKQRHAQPKDGRKLEYTG